MTEKAIDWVKVYQLLKEGFSEEALRRLCLLHDDFEGVEIGEQHSRVTIVRKVIEWAKQQMVGKALLTWAKKQNGKRYEAHTPYYRDLIISTEVLIEVLGDRLAQAVVMRLAEQEGEPSAMQVLLAQLLKEKPSAQREAKRFFEGLGERLAESLVVIFEMEGAELSEAEQRIVAEVVADSLHQPKGEIQSHNNLHQRVWWECWARVKMVIYILPELTSDDVYQLHKYLEEIHTGIRKLENTYRISQASNTDPASKTFEAQYRRLLSVRLDKLVMFGVQEVRDHDQPLSVAYITLTVTKAIPEEELPEVVELIEESLAKRERHFTQIEQAAPEALTQGKRLLIVGRAGSGKTTLLKWVAVQTANQDFGKHSDTLYEWQEKVPFFLRLRDFAYEQLPNPVDLATQTPETAMLKEQVPQNWVVAQLEGRAVVLVDGLDEVNLDKQEDAYRWLERLIALYPDAIYIVSSRSETVNDKGVVKRFKQMDFTRLDMQDMNAKAVNDFIAHWHEAMGDERCLLPKEAKRELPMLEEKLRATLQQQPKVRDLARNPLLCALLCALNQATRSQLPDDRIELYQVCLKMLLETRDKERLVDDREYGTSLNYREKEALLAKLAGMMMLNDQTVISEAEAIEQLTQGRYDGEKVWQYLLERSGLLQQQRADEFEFVHRTFQEYLAARYIFDQALIPFACRNGNKINWHETIRLLVGVASTESARQLILKELYATAEKEGSATVHILALESVGLMPAPSPQVLQLAAQHLMALVKDSKILVLAQTQVSDLSLLTFTHLPELHELYLDQTQINDLTPLTHLPALTTLWLSQTQVSDLTPLANLSKLLVLDIRSVPLVMDWTPLLECSSLKAIWVSDPEVLPPALQQKVDINPHEKPWQYVDKLRRQQS